jgi:3-phenylpropionate/trans-cinnamate dioxygenase ferredoxin subunit
MTEKKYSWHKIADSLQQIEFGANNIAVAELNGKKICIGKFKDQLYAIAFHCPHAGGIMANGYIDAVGHIVCPLHRYKFDMKNGRNVSGEGYYLKHWPVEVRDDGIFAGIEKSGSFWDFFR